MTKILIISDDHNDFKKVTQVLKNEAYDMAIHLGDSQISEKVIAKYFTHYVGGNHDNFSIYEDVFTIENIKFAIAHGHTINVTMFSQVKQALNFAKSKKADIVLFGHIHYPIIEKKDNINIICPGSISLPRNGSGQSYIILDLDQGKVSNIELKLFKEIKINY